MARPLTTVRMAQRDEDSMQTPARRGGLSRQDLFILVPAALSLATGTAILRNMIADDRVYEDRHTQVFSVLQVRHNLLVCHGLPLLFSSYITRRRCVLDPHEPTTSLTLFCMLHPPVCYCSRCPHLRFSRSASEVAPT